MVFKQFSITKTELVHVKNEILYPPPVLNVRQITRGLHFLSINIRLCYILLFSHLHLRRCFFRDKNFRTWKIEKSFRDQQSIYMQIEKYS